MGLKQRRKTISNGDKWHKDGLNTDMDIANSSKCKLTLFEIQTREIHAPPPPPPQRGPLLYHVHVAWIWMNEVSYFGSEQWKQMA